MKRILIVVGTRPNIIKITQFKKVADTLFHGQFDIRIVHTGQHYDSKMADVFFTQFGIEPDFLLNIKPESPSLQIGNIIAGLAEIIEQFKPDWVMAVGDVNSTLAAALAANKTQTPLAHLESGLRSFDRSMPEEINRILTDEITDLFFVTEQSGVNNLLKEGKKASSIHFVGNTMIDTMVAFEDKIQSSNTLDKFSLNSGDFVLMTMHRPANVDTKSELEQVSQIISSVSTSLNVVLPVHPRTLHNLRSHSLLSSLENNNNLTLCEPLDYFSFHKLISSCRLIITDSGGIQEEASFRKKPCITIRPNTERPVTIETGCNRLISPDPILIGIEIKRILQGEHNILGIPPLWDGKATQRVLSVLSEN
jgi:UDP-N-acetylglucosamine 2-epimerase (non-hydrolysing)